MIWKQFYGVSNPLLFRRALWLCCRFYLLKKELLTAKQVAEGELGSAEEQAKRILEDAKRMHPPKERSID